MKVATFLFFLFGSALAACPNVPGWMQLNGTCYLTSPSPLTWFQAEEFCGVKGGYLAEIQSEQESRLVASILHQEKAYWIGLTDLANSGHYVWQHSFKPLTWSNWRAGSPDSASQHCVEMYWTKSDWKWNDNDCKKLSLPLGFSRFVRGISHSHLNRDQIGSNLSVQLGPRIQGCLDNVPYKSYETSPH